MSNRLLSLLILVLLFGGAYGIYYYYFTNNSQILLNISGTGSSDIRLTSEYKFTYDQKCEASCLFTKLPAVNYSLSVTRNGYIPIEKNIKLARGEEKRIVIAMEKEVILTELTRKKEDTINTLKIKKSIQETLETTTGSIILGYKMNRLYYALPNGDGWSIFTKKEKEEVSGLFKIPAGQLDIDSLDIYEGYLSLKRGKQLSFYSLIDGQSITFQFSGTILGIKDTQDDNIKIIKSDIGVFLYSISEKIARINPLYDDIIQLSSKEIVVLVKKSSKEKQSLLNITDTFSDYVLLIGKDTTTRKILLQTEKNGTLLRYKNREALLITQEGESFVIKNVQ